MIAGKSQGTTNTATTFVVPGTGTGWMNTCTSSPHNLPHYHEKSIRLNIRKIIYDIPVTGLIDGVIANAKIRRSRHSRPTD